MKLRVMLSSLVCVLVMVVAVGSASAKEIHQLALQISDNNKQKMNTVLNVAANVSRLYSSRGEEIEIKIVAFNAGLHMLRHDTSPVAKRVQSFGKSMPNVSFLACNNTLKGMTKKEGKKPELLGVSEIVPAGVVTLIELNEAGWTIIRP